VFVSGSDVYVCGNASLWKNGTMQELDFAATSVFVSSGDVYVIGVNGRCGVFMKNGVQKLFPYFDENWKPLDDARCLKSIFVSGSDVYLAGNNHQNGMLWKNNVPFVLGDWDAQSVFVSGSDVCVAGRGRNGTGAFLWKNGTTQRLSKSGSASAYSVFVK
jgi:predicted heme/steroid binding protein